MYPVCALCTTREADKTNSHIVPKFLTKSLFYNERGRHAIEVHVKKIITDAGYEGSKVQDTPKDDFLLCATCESKLSILETYFAIKIQEIHSYKNLPSQFEYIIDGVRETIKCKDIKILHFKLFFYSIIWRLSVSKNNVYSKFKLPLLVEKELKLFLNNNLPVTHQQLKKQESTAIPEYHLCIIKPKDKLDPPQSFLSAYSFNENIHFITLGDFILFFILNDSSIDQSLAYFSNKKTDYGVIGLGDNDLWGQFNSSLFSKMISEVKL